MKFMRQRKVLFFLLSFATCTSLFSVTLETERLVLRLIAPEDAAQLFEFTSDPEVVKLAGLFKLHVAMAETKEYIQRELAIYAQGTSIMWVIVYKPHNKVIGIVNVFSINSKHAKAEIAYALGRNYWGQGILTEAGRAIVDYGFNVLHLNRIQATYDPRNAPSGRVLEKLGFQREGLLRNYYYLKDEFCDRIIVSLLKNEHTLICDKIR